MKKLLTLTFLLIGAMAVEAQSRFQLLHEMPTNGLGSNSKWTLNQQLQVGDSLFWVMGSGYYDSLCTVGVTNLRTGQYTIITDSLTSCLELTKFGDKILFYTYDFIYSKLWSWDRTNGLTKIADNFGLTIQGDRKNLFITPNYCYFRETNNIYWALPLNQLQPIQLSGPIDGYLSEVYVTGDSIVASIRTYNNSFSIWQFNGPLGQSRNIANRNNQDLILKSIIISDNHQKISFASSKLIYGSPPRNINTIEEADLTTGLTRTIDTVSYPHYSGLYASLNAIRYIGNKLLYNKRNKMMASESGIQSTLTTSYANAISFPSRRKSLILVNKEVYETDGATLNLLLDTTTYNNGGYSANSISLQEDKILFTATEKTSLAFQVWELHSDSIAPHLLGTVPSLLNNGTPKRGYNELYLENGEIYIVSSTGLTNRIFKEDVREQNGFKLLATFTVTPAYGGLKEISLVNNHIILKVLKDRTKGIEYYRVENDSIVLVKEIRKGGLGLYNSEKTHLTNEIVFEATDGINGFELWTCDGTTAGTRMIENFSRGGRSSDWKKLGMLSDEKVVFQNIRSEDGAIALYVYDNSVSLLPLVSDTPQTYEWSKLVGPNWEQNQSYGAIALDVEQDTLGNIFHLFYGACLNYLEEGTSTQVPLGHYLGDFPCGTSYQISKHGPSGQLLWAKSLAMPNSIFNPPVMAVSKSGRVSVAFTTGGLTTFLDTIYLNNNGQRENTLLAEFDADGNLLWYRFINLTSNAALHAMVYDINGNLLLSGESWFFEISGGLRIAANDGKNKFISSFRPGGTLNWAKHISNFKSAQYSWGHQMICTKDNQIYLMTSSPYYTNRTSCNSPEIDEMYVSKFDALTGNTIWVKSFKSDGTCSLGWSGISSDGLLHLQGSFAGNLDLQDGFNLSGPCDAITFFSATIAPNGTTIACKATDYSHLPLGVYFSPTGVMYEVYETYNRRNAKYKQGYHHKYYNDATNILNIKASNKGQTLAEYSLNYQPGSRDILAYIRTPLLSFDKKGDMTLSTDCVRSLDTLPNFAPPKYAAPYFESYVHIVKFKPLSTSSPSVPDAQLAASDITLYPNPTTGYLVLQSDDRDFADMQYEVFDLLGRPIAVLRGESYGVGYQSLDVTPFAQGTYFLRCTLGGKTITTLKFVKL